MPQVLAGEGKKAAASLKRSYTRGKREFTFKTALYGHADVRTTLRTMQNGKCAFCESPLPQTTAGHVEHFRPKGEVQQSEGEAVYRPGYYWLAYEWTNLVIACEWCNTRAKRKLFPLQDPAVRARSHRGDLNVEAPLLLNPAEEDPALHLEFVNEEIKAGHNSLKGLTSIRVYRLDDTGLTDHRRAKLALFRSFLQLAALANPQPEVDEARVEAERWRLRIVSGEAEYSAMLRSALPSLLLSPIQPSTS